MDDFHEYEHTGQTDECQHVSFRENSSVAPAMIIMYLFQSINSSTHPCDKQEGFEQHFFWPEEEWQQPK